MLKFIAFFLTAVLVILKFAQIGIPAVWSWWWILSPLWIYYGIVWVASLIVIIFALLVYSKTKK